MTARRLVRAFLFALITSTWFFPARAVFTGPPQVKPWPTTPVALSRYCVLYDFGSRPGDPVFQGGPATLAYGGDGYIYSSTEQGGAHGLGTVFRVSPLEGKPPEVLYSFDGLHGSGPRGGLTRGSDGAFYGTTYAGGKYGVGTVFKITATGGFSVLWDFRNGLVVPPPVNRPPTAKEKLDAAGAYPISAPVEVNGTLYGVTTYAAGFQYGVIYQIGGGQYSGIYQFNPTDVAGNGAFPTSLSVDKDGSIWGVTMKGALGYGTVFKLQSGGASTVYKFSVDQQGSYGVTPGPDGMLYGTAYVSNVSFGIVYQVNPGTHQFTVIHKFTGNDGGVPVAELTLSQDGKLYGVTKGGGTDGRGVVFCLNLDGTGFATIFNMDLNDGRYAISPLLELTKDSFYGITLQGGVKDAGVFYHVAARMYPPPAHDSFYIGGTLGAQDSTVIIRKDVDAYQINGLNISEILASHGIRTTLACPRDPHIVQFVYRMRMNADGTPVTGPFSTSLGTFQLTADPANPNWHTDAIGYPNAYYDQAPGSSHVVRTSYVDILDAPQSATPNASWQVTGKDFCVCNCKVVRVVNWTRGSHFDPTTGTQSPPQYVNINIEAPPATDTNSAWSDTQMQWINKQLVKDGYDIILPN